MRRSAQLVVESLETRVLLTAISESGDYNYFVNGVNNQLIVSSGITPVKTDSLVGVTDIALIGGTSSNQFTISGFSGSVSIDGAGGGDTVTVNTGSGGTVTLKNSADSTPDTLIVHSPTLTTATTTVSPGNITVGGDTIVNNDTALTSLSLAGQISGSGDGLIINGTSAAENFTLSGASLSATGEPNISYHNYTSLTINGNGGNDQFTVNGVGGPTTLNAGLGNVGFVVNSNNDLLTLNGGSSGADTFTINSNSGTLLATGGGANDTFQVNNSASGMTLIGGTGANAFIVASNSAGLNLQGGANDVSDSFLIQSNSGTINAVGGSGPGTFEVDQTTAPVTLKGGAGNDSFRIAAPTPAIVTVIGGSGPIQTLEYDGTPVADSFNITGNKITGPLAPVPYSGISALTVVGEGGNDTFNVLSDSAPTTLIGGFSNDIFNIQADSANNPVTVDTGSGASVVNIGSNAPANHSKLSTIVAGVTVNGDGSDTVNIDNSGDPLARGGTLSGNELTGLGAGNIFYYSLDTLNLLLGPGGNSLTVASTSANTTNINTGAGNDNVYVQTTGGTTNVNTGGGTNLIDVGSTAPTLGGTLSQIQGTLNLVAAGLDTLNLDDTGSLSAKTGTLTSNLISGLSPANISYTGMASLSVLLGNKGDHFTIASTNAATVTNLTGGTGGDTLLLATDAGKTNITAGSGANQISIDSTGGITTVKDPAGTSSILVGNTAPSAGGILSTIQSALAVTGNANDTLTFDDTGDTAPAPGKLAAGGLSGLGLGVTGVTYGGVGTVNVDLSNAGNTFTVAGTSATVATVVNTGNGNDSITVTGDTTPVTINSGAGNDTVNIQATGGLTTLNLGGGIDAVYVSNNAPSAGSLQTILGALTVNGTATSTLTLDDSLDPAGRSGTLSDTSLIGIAPATIAYSGLGVLNLLLGTGGNTLAITNTSAATTNINTGPGIDLVNITGTGASTTTNLNTGGGANTNIVNLGDPGGNVAGILGALVITGNGHDLLNIDNSSSPVPNAATLTSTTLTGLTPAALTWSGIGFFTLSLGTQNNLLTVTSTIAGPTTLNGGPNLDTINLNNENGPVTVNTGSGNDVVNIPLTNAAVVVNTNTGGDTINVGSVTPPAGAVLSGVKSTLTVNGNGGDTVNLDDSGDLVPQTVQITATAVTGLSPAAIDYNTIGTLNVYTGKAADSVTVKSTSAVTNLYTGGAADTIDLSNGGLTGGITSPVNILGSAAADIVIVDDSADGAPATGSLTAATIVGAAPATITYAGASALTIDLGAGGNTFAITSTSTATTLNSGAGADTLTLVNDSAPLTINTQAGSDTVYVLGTGAATTINTGTPGADTIDVGSVLPPPLFNGGVLAGIAGTLSVNGNGADTLNLDDTGDTTAHPATLLTASALTGLRAATISYANLGLLKLGLGSGNVGLTVAGTSAAATTITTVGGNDTVNIQATTTPLNVAFGGSAVNTVNVGSTAPATGGVVSNVLGAVTIVGDGSDLLNVDDTGSSAARIGTLAPTVLTLGPATVNYSGLAQLNVNLGTGADVITVLGTAGTTATTFATHGVDTYSVQATSGPDGVKINTGATASTVNIGNAGLTSGINGPVVISGTSSAAIVAINDSADLTPATVTVTSSTVTGASPAPITYGGAGSLTVSLGAGGNTVGIASTFATTSTVINSGAGADLVTLTADAGPTTVNSQGGNDSVYVLSTGGATTVNTGAGNDVVDVGSTAPAPRGNLNSIAGTLTIVADPTTLNLDDTGSTSTKSAVVSGSSITGLSPAAINYSGVVNLNVNLGSVGDAVKVTGTSATGQTIITGGTGSETFTVAAPSTTGLPGVLKGPLTIDGGAGGADALTVDDTLDTTGRSITLTAGTISGLGGPITYLRQSSLLLKLGAGVDSLLITSVNPTTATTVSGVSAGDSVVINIAGDLAGYLNIQGNVGSATIGGNLPGTLIVTGKLSALAIGGSSTGTITAGSVGTISVAAAVDSATGTLLCVTQGGLTRKVVATDTAGAALSPATTFKLFYDGATAADPQVAVRVAAFGNPRFDLLLTSPATANYSLSRLDAGTSSSANVRNVVVEGNILPTITIGQAAYLGLATGTIGGVYLPSDNLAAVSTWGNIHSGTIRAASIQGVSLSTLTIGATTYALSAFSGNETNMLAVLATVPGAKKTTYYTSIPLPTETLITAASPRGAVGLFVDGVHGIDDAGQTLGTPGNGDFEEGGIQITDASTGVDLLYGAFGSNAALHTSQINQLSIVGDSASITSAIAIANLTSTGPLGSLSLSGNGSSSTTKLSLNNVTAPSILGSINLYGGTLAGTIQTTGVRYDPVTGAASSVPADIGSETISSGKVTGVSTTISLAMGSGSRIISRGNLFSATTISGPLAGLIAVQGDIGAAAVSGTTLSRFGGVTIGSGASTGSIVALGNVLGNISIGGSFSGRLAAEGAPIAGLPATRVGILGNVTLSGGLASGGAVISSGLVGDSIGETKLDISGTVAGFVAAVGSVTASTIPSGHLFQNLSGSNAAAIAAIWTNAGVPLGFDVSPGDLTGLGLILQDVTGLAITGGGLTGTIP